MATNQAAGTGARVGLAIGLAVVVAAVVLVLCGRPPSSDATSSLTPPPLPVTAPGPAQASVATHVPAPAPVAPDEPSAPPPARGADADAAANAARPAGVAARGAVLVEGADQRSAAAVPDQPTGVLDKEAIRGAIAATKPKIAACYESALAHDPDLQGSIAVEFTIEAVDGGGTVTAGEVNQTDMNAPFFEACVLKQVVDVPFPAPEGGGVVKVTYPFNFSNGAD